VGSDLIRRLLPKPQKAPGADGDDEGGPTAAKIVAVLAQGGEESLPIIGLETRELLEVNEGAMLVIITWKDDHTGKEVFRGQAGAEPLLCFRLGGVYKLAVKVLRENAPLTIRGVQGARIEVDGVVKEMEVLPDTNTLGNREVTCVSTWHTQAHRAPLLQTPTIDREVLSSPDRLPRLYLTLEFTVKGLEAPVSITQSYPFVVMNTGGLRALPKYRKEFLYDTELMRSLNGSARKQVLNR
jgi:hypothetical protein